MPNPNQAPHPAALDTDAARARIAALLRRKKLRGEEVGKALLWSLVSDYEQRNQPNPTPLLTQAHLDRMEAALPSEYERAKYEDYVQLHDALLDLFREAQGQTQQLQHGLYRLCARIQMAELIWKLDDMLEPISQNTLDPAVAALPHEVHGIFTEDFRAILDREDLREELASGRNQMVRPAYTFLAGYNATLSALAGGLDMPELRTLQVPLEAVRSQAAGYDAMIARCEDLLPDRDAQALLRICPPLALEKIQPFPETVQALTAKVEALGPAGCALRVAPLLVMSGPMEEA